jgi:hypothetical protein
MTQMQKKCVSDAPIKIVLLLYGTAAVAAPEPLDYVYNSGMKTNSPSPPPPPLPPLLPLMPPPVDVPNVMSFG